MGARDFADINRVLVQGAMDFPKSKVQWDYDTNMYTPGYWDANVKFILTP